MIAPGTIFEEMGVNYFGPVDGHDVSGLTKTLQNLKRLEGPRLLHIVTRKGKGYEKQKLILLAIMQYPHSTPALV